MKPCCMHTETEDGHEQLISNGGRFKPAFAKRDKKQTMIDLRGISTNWFKNQLCPSIWLYMATGSDPTPETVRHERKISNWDSHGLEIWSNHFCPCIGPNGGSAAMGYGRSRVHSHALSIRSHRGA